MLRVPVVQRGAADVFRNNEAVLPRPDRRPDGHSSTDERARLDPNPHARHRPLRGANPAAVEPSNPADDAPHPFAEPAAINVSVGRAPYQANQDAGASADRAPDEAAHAAADAAAAREADQGPGPGGG